MSQIHLDTPSLQAEKQSLTEFLSQPNAFSDPDFAKKNRRLSELDELITAGLRREELKKQLAEAKDMSSGDDELAELAREEMPLLEAELTELEEKLFVMLTPKDPNDEKNVIVEIRAGAGGDEASLFASELYRMYLRWCEDHEFKTEHISDSANDSGGYKEVVFEVKGDSPYARLKFESGVHRVQRVPVTAVSYTHLRRRRW